MRTIKSHQDFERVFKQGRRLNHPLIRMVICRSANEGDPGRVAFAAAKRLGNAVRRNRSKRVLREAARACAFPVSGYEIILFATPKTAEADPMSMASALRSLMKRAGIAGCALDTEVRAEPRVCPDASAACVPLPERLRPSGADPAPTCLGSCGG